MDFNSITIIGRSNVISIHILLRGSVNRLTKLMILNVTRNLDYVIENLNQAVEKPSKCAHSGRLFSGLDLTHHLYMHK